MNIGLFGDSYIDLIWHRYNKLDEISNDKKIWAQLLLEDLQAPFICSGLGGTSQYYAIQQWQEWSEKIRFNVAIFTLTWDHRLAISSKNEETLRAYIEGRDTDKNSATYRAVEQYFEHLYDRPAHEFAYELMVKWCMELPSQYPDTKFIFIPNTELALTISKRHHSQGVLLDLAMERLSLAEGERVGVYPFIQDRYGHLSPNAHQQFKNVVKNVITDYQSGVVPVRVEDFNLVNLYLGYYDTTTVQD